MSAVQHKLAHGRGLATLFPAYGRWLLEKNRGVDRISRLGRMLFSIDATASDAAAQCIAALEDWLAANSLLQSATQVGISEDQFDTVAAYAVSIYGDGNALDVLGPMHATDIVAVLKLTKQQER